MLIYTFVLQFNAPETYNTCVICLWMNWLVRHSFPRGMLYKFLWHETLWKNNRYYGFLHQSKCCLYNYHTITTSWSCMKYKYKIGMLNTLKLILTCDFSCADILLILQIYMEYGSCEGLDRHYRCCIVVCLIGRAAILVIMYVEISKTDDIVLIDNVMVCLMSHWPINIYYCWFVLRERNFWSNFASKVKLEIGDAFRIPF